MIISKQLLIEFLDSHCGNYCLDDWMDRKRTAKKLLEYFDITLKVESPDEKENTEAQNDSTQPIFNSR